MPTCNTSKVMLNTLEWFCNTRNRNISLFVNVNLQYIVFSGIIARYSRSEEDNKLSIAHKRLKKIFK